MTGAEAVLRGALSASTWARASYTWLDTEDRDTGLPLLRRPKHRASVTVGGDLGRGASAELTGLCVGERDDVDATTYLRVTNPAYFRLDAGGHGPAALRRPRPLRPRHEPPRPRLRRGGGLPVARPPLRRRPRRRVLIRSPERRGPGASRLPALDGPEVSIYESRRPRTSAPPEERAAPAEGDEASRGRRARRRRASGRRHVPRPRDRPSARPSPGRRSLRLVRAVAIGVVGDGGLVRDDLAGRGAGADVASIVTVTLPPAGIEPFQVTVFVASGGDRRARRSRRRDEGERRRGGRRRARSRGCRAERSCRCSGG